MFDSLKRRMNDLEKFYGVNPVFPAPPEIEIEFVSERNPNAEPKYPLKHDDLEGTE